MSKCEHNKDKYYCKECGGKGICQHGKYKHNCIECGGSGICTHGKRKSRCLECNGTELCEHNISKYNCKDCMGNGICIHKKQKHICKECGGSGICNHGKNKNACKDCHGTRFCLHNKQKARCIECGGNALCEHNKQTQFCVICKGTQICEHNNRKYTCKECGGNGICIHGINKSYCKECEGSSICKHKKEKRHCKECEGSRLCKNEWCETTGNTKYEGFCVACFVNNPENQDKPAIRNYKTKEKDVVDRITQTFTSFTWVADKKVQDGCSRRRPDLLLDMGTHIIIVEIDENKHTDYDCSCENKRLMELSQDLQHRPIVFIRFNPDDYTNQDDILVKSCWKLNKLGVMQITKTKQKEWEERIESLKQQIQYWIDNPTEKTIEIIELFY